MTNTINTLDIQTYNDNMQMLSQQMTSRFRGAVMEGMHTGESARVVDQIGSVRMQKKTQKHADNIIVDTPHDARWVYHDPYYTGDYIDEEDRLTIGIAPDGHYVKAGVYAGNNEIDHMIIDSFFGDARTGSKGQIVTSFDASNVINANVGASAATGMNTTKLLRARKGLIGYDIELDDPSNQMFCGITEAEEEDLINQVKVSSRDFQDSAVLSGNGTKLDSWFGINFIVSTKLKNDGTNVHCPFWVKSGMHLGIWKDVHGDIRRDGGKQGNPIYIEAGVDAGATRTEEKKVFKILSKLRT